MSTTKQQPDLDVYAVPVDADVSPDDRTGKIVDPRAFQTGYWSHALSETGAYDCPLLEGKYGWCYCFVLAQIESRIGKASYDSALWFHMTFAVIAYVILLIGLVGIAIILANDYVMSDSMSSFMMAWAFISTAYLFVWVFSQLYSLVDTRSQVRKRFQIPNEPLSDCFVMRRRNAAGLRQMALHLKIDQAGTFDRVDTLPPFEE